MGENKEIRVFDGNFYIAHQLLFIQMHEEIIKLTCTPIKKNIHGVDICRGCCDCKKVCLEGDFTNRQQKIAQQNLVGRGVLIVNAAFRVKYALPVYYKDRRQGAVLSLVSMRGKSHLIRPDTKILVV
jgi:hypothetical protein